MAGGIGRRCRCRDENGKDLGVKCPDLQKRKHGTWYVRQELTQDPSGKRNVFRRSGFESKDDAEAELHRIRELINLADDDEDDLQAITEMLMALDRREKLPELEDIKRQLRSKAALNTKIKVGAWLDTWFAQRTAMFKQGRGSRGCLTDYEIKIRLYLKPKIGHVRLDRLSVDHLINMFNDIADDNDQLMAANDDRRAKKAAIEATRSRAEKRRLRAELATMPPYRKPIGLSSKAGILATLRASINDAIRQDIATFNPASYYSVGAKPPKPIVWTPERVEKWQATGERPGPVMVWTPKLAGSFLDYVADHDPQFAAMWHLLVYRGPRRGEIAGLGWAETHTDKPAIEITTQLTEVKYVVEESDPKTEAGVRTIPLDEGGATLLKQHRARQHERKLGLGAAWIDSGKVFTYDDGSSLRPSWISERFVKLCTAAGLPPIRLHDLRHTAATLMLAAGVEMKVVQETLGHAALATTSDIYTSVLPEVAKAAAKAVVDIVPRKPARAASKRSPAQHPSGTQDPLSGTQDCVPSAPKGLSAAPPLRRSTRRAPKRSTSAVDASVAIA